MRKKFREIINEGDENVIIANTNLNASFIQTIFHPSFLNSQPHRSQRLSALHPIFDIPQFRIRIQ